MISTERIRIDKEYLQHAWIQKHNPWISDEEREYWADEIKEANRYKYLKKQYDLATHMEENREGEAI